MVTDVHRILAATDLSAYARHAAERAACVSKDTRASLDLVHVANLALLARLRRLVDATAADMEQRVLDAARTRLDELLTALERRYGVKAGIQVRSGPVIAELTKAVEASASDLIVCGARGDSIVRRHLLGTTALRLLEVTRRPVLIVKQAPHDSYRRALVPIDFSSCSIRAIEAARSFAPQAEIVLLTVFDVPFEGQMRYANVDDAIINHYRMAAKREASEKLAALQGEVGLLSADDGDSLVLHGDPAQRIVEQEQERDCDLIVMGKHGKSVVNDLLLGSVTQHVLADAQCDVLVAV